MASRSTTTASTDLAEALTVAVTVIRAADGTLLYANPQFGTLLGASTIAVGEAIDTVLGESGAHVALTTAAEENVGEVELHGRCPDGRPISLLASARQISFGDEPRALLAAFRDASLRRQLEGEVARLAEFPEMNPGPACRLDPDGTVVLANAAASRLFEEDALVGSRWHDLVTGIDEVVWASVLASTEPLAVESEVGDVVVLFTYVSRDSGETVFVFGADITARRRAELQAETQAAQLAEVARFPDMNPGPVLRLDLDATVLLANAAARDILGADVVGQCWRDLCPGLEETTWSAALESPVPIPLEAHVGDRDYVFQHRRDLETEFVFVFGTDVTHQKQAERVLRQTEKMATLGTLVAGVAHELNNPAAATRRAADQLHEQLARLEQSRFDLEEVELTTEGLETLRSLEQRARDAAEHPGDLDPLDRSDNEAELEDRLASLGIEDAYDLTPSLVAQGVDDAVLARLANTIDESAIPAALAWLAAVFPVHALVYEIGEGSSRISEIVAALRSYSYLGQAPIQEIDVHEGLDSTLVILRSKLKEGVTVQREYCTDMPRFPAFGSELNQVWTNLIDNAVAAMDGHGELVIRTRQDDGWAVIEIEDHGPGIPEEIQSQVFDPFFTTKEPGKGTGLGLSTSSAIVTEKHGGTMSVESRPGHTCFTVRLPTTQRSL